MFVVITIAVFLVAATAAAPASDVSTITAPAVTLSFRPDYPYYSSARKFFKLHRSPASWGRAREICHQEGAELASPDTPQQVETLASLQRIFTPNGRPADLWLGIYATWRTVYDKSAFDSDDEPPIGVGIYLTTNGLRRPANYTVTFPFVCEVSEATACNASDSDYAFGPNARSCYKLHKTQKTWPDALLTCEAEGAQLAIINSQQEADHLKTLSAGSNDILIGLYELSMKVKYITLDGHPIESSGYAAWVPGEPNNPGGNFRCGGLRNGKYILLKCDITYTFICEKKVSTVIAALFENQLDFSISEVEQS